MVGTIRMTQRAVAAMRKAWAETRDTYERVAEGSIAVLFHDPADVSTRRAL